jgi:PAS domain S-box-containing protein
MMAKMPNFNRMPVVDNITEGLNKEISELKSKLEQAERDYYSLIEKTNQNLKDLFDNSNDLITIFKPTGEIRFANAVVKNKLGYTEDEILDLKFIEVVHEDHRRNALQNILKITAGSLMERFETVLISKSGKNIYVTGKLTSIFENNEPVEYRCVFYDISERIRAESAQSLYYQIANITITENDLANLYQNIYSQLSQMLMVKNFNISLKSKGSYKTIFKINEHDQKIKGDIEIALMDYTFDRKRSLIVYEEGIQKIEAQSKKKFKDPIPKIWLGVIIYVDSRPQGIMSVCNYNDQSAFNNKDLELLDFISGQISLAMERKEKEDKIENQAATLGAIFDSSTHQIWSVDRNLKFTSFNHNYAEAFKTYFGVEPQIGVSLHEIKNEPFTDEFKKFWDDKYKEAFQGKFVNFQISTVNNAGKIIWREVFLNPIFLPNGRIEELSIIANDISDKKESESALISSEEKFRTIFESFQDIYFRCTMDGFITMISPSVQELLKYDPATILGDNVMKYLRTKQPLEQIMEKLFEEKRLRDIEGVVRDAKGNKVNFLCNIRLIQKEDGITEIEGVGRDISKLKETTKELERAKDVAERSLKIKERFLANMSHEIRTPMNGIIGMLDLISSTQLDKEQSEYIKTINKSSQTLLNILNDILDLSKIEAGKMELRQDPFQLVKTIEKVYDLFSQQALLSDNVLYYHIDEKIPDWIVSDETRLIQVLSNLTSNAIKFSRKKGNINISLRLIKSVRKEHTFKVTIKDSGIGISENDQKTLFQNFHQIDNSTTKNFGGTGLGLAISKELAKSMNGDIGVVSTPGLGSTFWFTFKAKEIASKKVQLTQTDPSFTKQFVNKAPRVLLVDDNDVNRKVAKGILEKSGCEIIEAIDGYQAIRLAKKGDYDLIFMDIQMPKMSGVKATQKIKALKLKDPPPIIAMTAYSMEEDRQKFLDSGLDDYLAKPIKADVLINKVKSWLEFEPNQITVEPISEQSKALVINQNTINQLAKFGGYELIETTLVDFEEEAEMLVKNTKKFLKKKDYKAMKGELHTLKGNAGTLGIEKLSKQAASIEKLLKANKFDNLKKEVTKLTALFEEFKESSQNMLITNE